MAVCGIYKITNQTNGKIYIGQSINIQERWKSHIYNCNKEDYYGYNYPLYQAFRKYGLENFKFEVIEECSKEQLNEKEYFYIDYFQCYSYNNKGYNQDFKDIERVLKCSRLTPQQVIEIIDLLKNVENKFKHIALKFGCSLQTISNINNGVVYRQKDINYPIRLKQKNCNYCKICGKEIQHDSIYCKEHMGISYSKEIPSKEKLLKDLYDFKKDYLVAEKYGISTVLLKDWKIKLEIPRKRQLVDKLYEEEYLGIIKEEKPKRDINLPIIQKDKNTEEIIQVFENTIQASNYIKINYQPNNTVSNIAACIHNCINKNVKSACGFKWECLQY